MPYVEMAPSPKIQNLIQALKYKPDGRNLLREHTQGKNSLWKIGRKLCQAQQDHRKRRCLKDYLFQNSAKDATGKKDVLLTQTSNQEIAYTNTGLYPTLF